MMKISFVFPWLVLIGSGLFIYHYPYSGGNFDHSTLRTSVGTIEFTGFQLSDQYVIASQPVQRLGIPIAKIRNGLTAVVSNVLPPGSQLYEIKGVSITKAIAVPWKGTYVEAVHTSS